MAAGHGGCVGDGGGIKDRVRLHLLFRVDGGQTDVVTRALASKVVRGGGIGDDMSTSLEPHTLIKLHTGVLGQQLRGQAAQSAQHSLTSVGQLSLTVCGEGGRVSGQTSGVPTVVIRVLTSEVVRVEASENRPNHLLRSGPYQAAVANMATVLTSEVVRVEASENGLNHLLRSGPYQAAVANMATGEGANWVFNPNGSSYKERSSIPVVAPPSSIGTSVPPGWFWAGSPRPLHFRLLRWFASPASCYSSPQSQRSLPASRLVLLGCPPPPPASGFSTFWRLPHSSFMQATL